MFHKRGCSHGSCKVLSPKTHPQTTPPSLLLKMMGDVHPKSAISLVKMIKLSGLLEFPTLYISLSCFFIPSPKLTVKFVRSCPHRSSLRDRDPTPISPSVLRRDRVASLALRSKIMQTEGYVDSISLQTGNEMTWVQNVDQINSMEVSLYQLFTFKSGRSHTPSMTSFWSFLAYVWNPTNVTYTWYICVWM